MIVHVFVCPTCNAETERTEEEMKGLRRVFCGSCDAWSEMVHDRVEIHDANGEVTGVII